MKFEADQNTTYLFQFFHENNHQHPKYAEYNKMSQRVPTLRGDSYTYCRVVEQSDFTETTGLETELFTSKATCKESDQFVKDTGRRIALKRALTRLNKGKEFNTRVWNQYNQETRKVK